MHHETSILTTHDGLKLFTQHWLPENPKAVLLIAHGYAEHSSRYPHVAEYFVVNNYAVYALDHRGHGKSEGARTDVDSFAQYIDDLKLFLDEVKKNHPNAPMIVLGHSMGGAIALHYVLKYPNDVDLLMSSGAYLIDGGNASPMLISISKMIAKLLPTLGVKALDSATISHDPAVVKAYDDDPLVDRNKVKARMAAALLGAGPYVFANMAKINLPILIMHGSADVVALPRGSHRLHKEISSSDKTLKIYEGFFHEILNEPEQKQVLADIKLWLDARL